MLEGPVENLKLTENTQPAIVAHSLMMFHKLENLLKQKNIQIERVLGHSVGEYAALAAAGAMEFEDAVKAVHFRGKYMQEATPAGKGTMYAILKQEEATIREACEAASTEDEKVSPLTSMNQIKLSFQGINTLVRTPFVLWNKEVRDESKQLNFKYQHLSIAL